MKTCFAFVAATALVVSALTTTAAMPALVIGLAFGAMAICWAK
jgi:hypothetical protein